MPMILKPSSSPTLLDVRKDEIPALREKIFTALHENIEGLTVKQVAEYCGEGNSFIALIMVDAKVEGELIRPDFWKHMSTAEQNAAVDLSKPVEVCSEEEAKGHPLYRLSPQKWIEMEAAACL